MTCTSFQSACEITMPKLDRQARATRLPGLRSIHDAGNQPGPRAIILIEEIGCSPPAVAARIRELRGTCSYRDLAATLDLNAETVRRYCRDGKPSVEFVQRCCLRLGVSADWMILGRDPKRAADIRRFQLRQATVRELLGELASRFGAPRSDGESKRE